MSEERGSLGEQSNNINSCQEFDEGRSTLMLSDRRQKQVSVSFLSCLRQCLLY